MATYAKLLGSASIKHEEVWLEPPAGKTSALLYTLAYRDSWTSRDELVFLFWPDTTQEKARRNLRRLLTSVRRLPYADALNAEPTRLRWPVATDVHAFKQALAEGRTAQAITLYKGPLLQSFSLSQTPEFENWLEQERQELHRVWRGAVLTFADELYKAGRYPEAGETLLNLRRADPFDEEALRRHLQALYASGRRSEALGTFATFQQSLKDELGGEPEDGTLGLVKDIREETLEVQPAVSASVANRRPALPVQPTPFVGRTAERAALNAALSDPACRLLTIVGPGGMGKTRLALEAAEAQLERFGDGVYFVPFASVFSPDLMVYAVADAVGFSFFGQLEPRAQLLEYLQTKHMLLVLDNLEHLLAGVELVGNLLERAPDIKILATSRERLNLHAERVFDLFGLAVPETVAEAEGYDAVKLFVQAASGTRADFALDDTNLPTVARICQHVQGMPLALELAASWLRALTLGDVAAELERGSDLETSKRDLPERHRSLRAVFDASWELLTDEERTALRKLSVFRGGFRREAASAVAGVNLPVLASLIDKSFLTMTAAGRYRRHPLIYQYTQEKLARHPEEKAETEEKHSLYYLRFVREREADLLTLERKKTLETVEEDLANLRLAWTWVLENERVEEVKSSALALGRFFSNRIPEGEALFAQAVAALQDESFNHRAALGYVLVQQAAFWSSTQRRGTRRVLERGLALLRPLEEASGVMRGLALLGWAAYFSGNVEEAAALFREGRALAQQHDPRAVGEFSTGLVMAEQAGSFEQAKRAFEETLAELQHLGDLEHTVFLKQQFGVYLALNAHAEEGEKLLLETLQKQMEPGELAEALERGERLKLEEVVAELLKP